MPALPRVPPRLIEPARRVTAALCLLMALGSWLTGPGPRPAESTATAARLARGETATTVSVSGDVSQWVRAGDFVDLVAPSRAALDGTGASGAAVVAQHVRVVRVRRADSGLAGSSDGSALVVAAARATTVAIASALDRAPFAVVVTP